MAEKPAYRINKKDIPYRRAKTSAAMTDVVLQSQRVHGIETSIMFAERGPGYHTRPHTHDAEQINYVLSGEIWFFVEDHGYRCRPGDLMRIPRNKVHWAMVRETANEHAFVIESHSPPLPGNTEEARKTAVPLLGPGEELVEGQFAVNHVFEMDPEKVQEIEARALAEEGDQ